MTRFSGIFFIFTAAAAAWSVSIAAHELVGHGGVCTLNPNCQWLYADAMYFDGTPQTGAWKIAGLAAGSAVNILIGLIAILVSRRAAALPPVISIPIHLLIPVSFIQSGAYIAFGSFIHPGMDWPQIAAASAAPEQMRTLFMVIGLLLIGIGVIATRATAPMHSHWTRYVLTSYAGFAATALAASAFVPSEDRLFMLAGGLGSGGLFMAFYLAALLPFLPIRRGDTTLPSAANLWPGILLYMFITVLYVYILGSGVTFTHS